MMNLLVRYGFSHEDTMYSVVDLALNSVYEDAATLCADASGDKWDDEDRPAWPFYQLYEFVVPNLRAQFVTDLRNAVSVAIGGYVEDVVASVLLMREA